MAVIEVVHVNNSLILKQKETPIFNRLKFQVITLYEARAFCYYSTQVSFASKRMRFSGSNKSSEKFYAWKIAVNSSCFSVIEVAL
jgi:hypothetical protein